MKTFDAVVIGAGPGGYPCAIRLAQLGLKTAIIEREYWGGVCLNVGCIPSKALIHAAKVYNQMTDEADLMGFSVSGVKHDMAKTQEWKSGVVKKLTGGIAQILKANKVEMFSGTATFIDKQTIEVTASGGKERISAKNFVIATGSRPIEIPILKFNGKNVMGSTEALALKEVPKKLIVIGGGFIGVEIGMAYAKMGSEVSIVEAQGAILPSIDRELVAVVEKHMRKLGIKLYVGYKALGLQEKDPANSATVHLDIEGEGKKETLEATHILVSAGRRPNSDGFGLDKLGVQLDKGGNILTNTQSQTNVPGIWAIGDVAGAPQLAHRATRDGCLAAEAIAGHRAFKDYKVVPWAVFCDPEIAVCGLTEKEAQEKGLKVRVGKFPFVANGRALSINDSDGFIKVVMTDPGDTIVGVHMVGPEVSNLIAECALAIEMGACADDIIHTIHTHPTLPEALPEAIESAFSMSIHVFKPARPASPTTRPADARA